jgi:hypothetical protein
MFCQVAAAAGSDSTVVYGGVKSSYMLMNAVPASKAPVLQGGVTFTRGSYYLDLWGSHPLRDVGSNSYGKEIDITLGHNGEVAGMNLLVALAHYNLVSVGKIDGHDTIDVIAEVSPKAEWYTVVPYLKVEVLNSSGFNMHNAIATSAGIRKSNSFNGDWSLSQQLQLSHQPQIPGLVGTGTVGYYKANLGKQIGEYNVGMSYERYQPFGMDAGRGPRNVIGVNFAMKL